MDIRYFDYIERSNKYYLPSTSRGVKFLLKVPKNWAILEGDHWVNVYSLDNYLKQDQGWKLHISTDIYQAQEVLNTVSKVLFEKGIPYKFVKDNVQLIAKNSKYAARESSGKFITIYPNQEDLYNLLLELEDKLKYYNKGAYILSDRRWKDSNIYYRYGGFSPKYLVDGRLGIHDNYRNLVEDKRVPFYLTPDWVKKPKFIIENEYENYKRNTLEDYNITEALHFSNGGGVYLATDSFSKKVILKEARLNAGLDGLNNDAIYRLKREHFILNKLSKLTCVPKVYDIFNVWEHVFLVEEYIDGETLASWFARNYPFSKEVNCSDYVNKLKKIAYQCCESLKKVHEQGYTHGDIQPKNIIVKTDYTIKFIDFENYDIVGSRGKRTLGTPGFYKKFNDYNEEKDWTGLLRVFKTGLLSISNLEMISENVYDVHYDWIKSELGDEAVSILDMVLDYSCNSNYNILSETNKPFTMYENIDINSLHSIAVKSLINNIDFDKISLINGDIKQFIYNNGEFSIGFGSSGVLLLLSRLNELNFDISIWINKINNINFSEADYGLFSGLTGLANSLVELGYKVYAEKIFNNILLNKERILKTTNISLESGLSGIALSVLDYYISTKNKDYLILSKLIYEKIREVFYENDMVISNSNSGFTNDGLIYGWSGVIWLSYALFNVTKEEKYLKFTKEVFYYELDKMKLENGMVFLASEEDKLLPYFSNGSAGFLLTAILIREHIEEENLNYLIKGVVNAITAKPPVFFGLFEGYIGLSYVAKIVDRFLGNTNYFNYLLKNYNLYILKDSDNNMVVPGNFSYRVSYDLATGLSGLLACINIDNYSGFLWLPLINQNKLFKYNKNFV